MISTSVSSYHSPRPVSRRLFLVSRVISGAAGQLRLAPLSEQDDATAFTVFSCDSAVSSNEGVLLSLCSVSPDAPPLSSRGESRCSAEAADAMLSCRPWRGSRASTNPLGNVSEAISGIMSWDIAVEAEEITSGERALVGDVCGSSTGSIAWRSRDMVEFGEGNTCR